MFCAQAGPQAGLSAALRRRYIGGRFRVGGGVRFDWWRPRVPAPLRGAVPPWRVSGQEIVAHVGTGAASRAVMPVTNQVQLLSPYAVG